MGISSKIASIADELFPLKLSGDDSNFPALLDNLECVLIVFPKKFDDEAIATARKLIDVLGKRVCGILIYEKVVELEGIKNIVLTEKDFNIAGRPKKAAVASIAEFTASIDISGEFASPLSALPAIAKIPLRIGADESRADGAYNFVVIGSMEKIISNLMESADEQRRSRQKRAR
ncbi:MAG TPA: hypothetical protein ENN07_05905 [candidate division Zixibacteria bacterium]|nr:hypothetical protein [candidate division Zixibacteria bacterium]